MAQLQHNVTYADQGVECARAGPRRTALRRRTGECAARLQLSLTLRERPFARAARTPPPRAS